MPRKKPEPPAPKISGTRLPSHPSPGDPKHEECQIDEAEDESFPASDPSSMTQPPPKKDRSRAKK